MASIDKKLLTVLKWLGIQLARIPIPPPPPPPPPPQKKKKEERKKDSQIKLKNWNFAQLNNRLIAETIFVIWRKINSLAPRKFEWNFR